MHLTPPRPLLLAALLLSVSSLACGEAEPARPTTTTASLAARYPAAAALLERARRDPAEPTGAGFRLGAAPPALTASFRSTTRPLAATLPLRADGALRLGDAPHEVVVRRRAAQPAEGAVDNGAVVYRGASDGVDAVLFADGPAIEELLVVHAPRTDLGYDVDLPEGWALQPVAGARDAALVEVRDDRGVATLRVSAAQAWDAAGRAVAVELRADARGLALSVADGALYPVLVDPSWVPTSVPLKLRTRHTATLLAGGRVLIAGGLTGGVTDDSAEICDSRTGQCAATTTPMREARHGHTATMLPDGKVLIAGGRRTSPDGPETTLQTAELFDPETDGFTSAGTMVAPRGNHTATLLSPRRVLLAGGGPEIAEIYDATTGTFTATGAAAAGRGNHAAVLLQSGKVLLVGGDTAWSAAAEIFDPDANGGVGAFTPTGAPQTFEVRSPTATRLRDGRVLVTGGCPCAAVGGSSFGESSTAAEIFDPDGDGGIGAFTPTASLRRGRLAHTATLLPSGEVLLAGGTMYGTSTDLEDAEIYTPETGLFSDVPDPMSAARGSHTATLLPSGDVLLVGGSQASIDLYVARGSSGPGGFAGGPWMMTGRSSHPTTLLDDGRVLFAGGRNGASASSAAELYDGAAGAFAQTGSLVAGRLGHSMTLLGDGRVLVAGGRSGGGVADGSAEIFDPAANGGAGAFQTTGSMVEARSSHAAVRLPSGRVLAVGGFASYTEPLASAEIFDPESGSWSRGGQMMQPRREPAAALLPNGLVLIASETTAELYDPARGTFAPTRRPPGSNHLGTTITVLPTGKALIAGGFTREAETYDPATETWSFTSPASAWRIHHAATLLPTGSVLFTGGDGGSFSALSSAEIFTPLGGSGRGAFYPVAGLLERRQLHDATLLPSGKVLVSGGDSCASECIASDKISTELWTTRGEAAPWRPVIASAPAVVAPGDRAPITGSGFIGPEGSGGRTSSSTSGFPIAVWQPASNNGLVPSPVTGWTDTGARWVVPATAFYGKGWLRVIVNGIASAAVPVEITSAAKGERCRFAAECATGFCADGVCCDAACDGPCDGCSAARKGEGEDGVCGVVPADRDLADACVLSQGAPCSSGSDCSTGQCVDGVCCDSACTEQCEACDVDGSIGKCVPATGQSHGDRITCNLTTPDDPCDAAVCDGLERTRCAGTVGPCAPFACGAEACEVACSDEIACAPGFHCQAAASADEASRCVAGQCDGAVATASDGTVTDCSPYLCEADGTCRTRCAKVSDCLAPFACNAAGECEARPTGDPAGGCAVQAATSREGALGALGVAGALVASLAGRARRRRWASGNERREGGS